MGAFHPSFFSPSAKGIYSTVICHNSPSPSSPPPPPFLLLSCSLITALKGVARNGGGGKERGLWKFTNEQFSFFLSAFVHVVEPVPFFSTGKTV